MKTAKKITLLENLALYGKPYQEGILRTEVVTEEERPTPIYPR